MRRLNSRFFASKRLSSVASRAKARTRRAPLMFSCALAEISLKNSWIAVKRRWVILPMTCVAAATKGRTASATSVRSGEANAIRVTAIDPTTTVFAACMIPGPIIILTADRSLTARLMTSPTRLLRCQRGGSRRRCAKRSSRISNSTSREAPMRIRRVKKKRIASVADRARITAQERAMRRGEGSFSSDSRTWRTIRGMARKRAAESAIVPKPRAYAFGRREK